MVLNHSFSVDQTSFSVKLLLWPKSLRLKSKYFIFFGSIVFWFWQPHIGICLYRQNWSNRFELSTASTKYMKLVTWLHVSPIPAIHLQLEVLIFAVFSSVIKFCEIYPLLTDIFYILLWWYSTYFLKGNGIAKVFFDCSKLTKSSAPYFKWYWSFYD